MQFSNQYSQFPHLLERVDFDAIVDHFALTHIIKSKVEPPTVRIKRLSELITSYSFNLYYIKGKNVIWILKSCLDHTKNTNIYYV